MERKKFPFEIVITGMSGRFPESANLEEFRDNLFNGVDMVTEDDRRWKGEMYDMPHRMGKLKELDKFDAGYFGVHGKQTNTMDPRLRILLEVVHEAIVDAGVNPVSIRGSKTGVFIGAGGEEARFIWSQTESSSGYITTGCSMSMFANRVSFTFDFKGPSFPIDTACSSGLLALQQAVLAMRGGLCDAAIVASVHTCVEPETTLQFTRLGMAATDGKCKSFDASGDGYVRSEAAVVFYICKAEHARRKYASIIHCRSNADGHKEQGVTFPSGVEQQNLMKETYEEIGIDPKEVSYCEAHGTGTKVGDPQEVNAIDRVMCKERGPENPLLIGSVKSNMGHSEPASGLCAIVKVILATLARQLPGNLHYKTPNPDIPGIAEGRIKVVAENTPWNGGLVAVNSFGFGGANVHVLLKCEVNSETSTLQPALNLPLIIPISGRTPESIDGILNEIEPMKNSFEFHTLLQRIHQENIPGHPYRGYSLILQDQCSREVIPFDGTKPPLWYIFSGMGSQWLGMARDLKPIRAFQSSLQKSADILRQKSFDLFEVLESQNELTFDVLPNAAVCIACIQIALVDTLRSLNLTPDGMIGHSIGELACAYTDGCLSHEETVLISLARATCIMNANLPIGAMVSVGMTKEEAVSRCPEDLNVACHNSENNVSISGPKEAIEAFAKQLDAEDVFCREIKTSGYAFHSQYMKSCEDSLRKALQEIIKERKPRSSKWISTSVEDSLLETELGLCSSVDYHVNNVLSPVLFKTAMDKIPPKSVVLELAPHSLLQAILKRSTSQSAVLGLTNKNAGDHVNYFLTGLGKLYLHGLEPSFSNLYPEVNFPVGNSVRMISPLITWDHSTTWRVAGYVEDIPMDCVSVYEVSLKNKADLFYAGHQINSRILFPATGFLFMVWKAFARRQRTTFSKIPVIFENVRFERTTLLPKDGVIKFYVNILRESGKFEINEGGTVTCRGTVRTAANGSSSAEMLDVPFMDDRFLDETYFTLSKNDVYKDLRLRGYDYLGAFQGIQFAAEDGQAAKLSWDENWVSFLDTLLQVAILRMPIRALFVPIRLQKAIIDPKYFLEYLENNKRTVETPEKSEDVDQESSEKDAISPYELVPVRTDQNLQTIQCPGIQLQGLKITTLNRKPQPFASPIYDDYSFERFYDPSEIITCKERTIKLFMEIVMENTRSSSFTAAEFVEKIDPEVLIAPSVSELAHLQPQFTSVQISVFTSNATETENEDLKSKAVKVLPTEESSQIEENSIDLIIAENSTLISTVVSFVKDNGFLLWLGDLPKLPPYFKRVAHKNSKEGALHLLRVQQNTSTFLKQFIEISHENFEWVSQMKLALKEESSPDNDSQQRRIYIISEGTPRSGILGLAKCITKEPNGGIIRCFFIKETLQDRQILADQMELDLLFNVYEDSAWGTYMHQLISIEELAKPQPVSEAYVNVIFPGDLSSLRWIQSPLEIKADPSFCQVHFAPLNFRDVMIATGKLAKDALPGKLGFEECVLGMEFSGVVPLTGKRVMTAIPIKGLTTSLQIDPKLVWEIPSIWSMAEAATVPMAYLTAYYSLIVRGRMRKGETLLIHAGSGGVGIAAITIALSMNCNVFVTVSSKEKREFLQRRFPTLTNESFADSRDERDFEKIVRQGTKGRGVDIVLNSLAQDKLQASIRCLGHYGRFIEIGKFDLFNNSDLGMEIFLKSITFHGILMDSLMQIESDDKEEVWRLMKEGTSSGVVQPLPYTIFSHDKLEEAFRYMASGKHMGKILIQIRDNDGTICEVKPDDDKQDKEENSELQDQSASVGKRHTEPDLKKQNQGSSFDKHYHDLNLDKLDPDSNFQKQDQDAKNALQSNPNLKVVQPLENKTSRKIHAIRRTYFQPSKSYVIIGGLGGLGLELANWMVERDAQNLVLASRSGVTTGYQTYRIKHWRKLGVNVLLPTFDITTAKGTEDLMVLAQTLGPVGGVFNLAMVLKDAIFENQTIQNFEESTKAKILTTINLDKVARERLEPLDYFVVFSSIVSGKGNPGQTSYGFSNSFMERVCEERHKKGLHGLAIQWGGIGDVGVVHDQMGGNSAVLAGTIPQRIPSCLETLDLFLQQNRPVVGSMVLARKSAFEIDDSKNLVDIVAHILGIPDVSKINPRATLIELGMDSLMGVEIKQVMDRKLNIVLPVNEYGQLTFEKLKEMEASPTTVKVGSAVKAKEFTGQKLFKMPEELLVEMESGNDFTAFLAHALDGRVTCLEPLVKDLKAKVIGIQCVEELEYDSIESLAKVYVDEIKRVQPEGPYYLMGYSFGATVAFEMTLQLEADGALVKLLLLDGSHSWLKPVFESIMSRKLEEKDDTIGLLVFMKQYMDLDQAQVQADLDDCETRDEKLELVAEIMQEVHLDFEPQELMSLARAFLKKLAACYRYQPKGKIQAKTTLLKSKQAAFDSIVGTDYGLGQVCEMEVSVIAIDGHHNCFYTKHKELGIAEIVNENT